MGSSPGRALAVSCAMCLICSELSDCRVHRGGNSLLRSVTEGATWACEVCVFAVYHSHPEISPPSTSGNLDDDKFVCAVCRSHLFVVRNS